MESAIRLAASTVRQQDPQEDIREDYWQPASSSAQCMAWLKKYNCYEAYLHSSERFMYDVRLDRLVFIIKTEAGQYTQAAGRLLKVDRTKPKWYMYGAGEAGFYMNLSKGEDKGLLIVEDCASACSAARVIPTLALLGTNCHSAATKFIVDKYKDKPLYIALDNDAIAKAHKLASGIQMLTNNQVKVVMFRDDIKYISSTEEISRTIEGS